VTARPAPGWWSIASRRFSCDIAPRSRPPSKVTLEGQACAEEGISSTSPHPCSPPPSSPQKCDFGSFAWSGDPVACRVRESPGDRCLAGRAEFRNIKSAQETLRLLPLQV
jgi:hypothetical protein